MRILHYIPSIDESSGGGGAYMQLLARDLGRLQGDLHTTRNAGSVDYEARPLEEKDSQVKEFLYHLNNGYFKEISKREDE